MNMPNDRLYNLLPSIYREKDLDRGELRSLLAIIGQELGVLEDNVGDLYEDWFIETCADWVVPYIGDLLGVSGIGSRSLSANGQQPSTYGQQERRAFVANTLAYRRRKGTAPVVEQLARDVTGWRARAVEFFDRLAIAQNINHIRPNNTTVNLRNTNLQLLGSPFEQQVAYSAEVHDRGKYNIPNIGLFLWRLQSYPITKVNAKVVEKTSESLRERCFTFSPLNNTNIPLFNPPQTETEITQLAEEINVPGRLRPDPNYAGYQGEQPAFQIFINGSSKPISPQEVLITDIKLNETTTLEKLQTEPAGEKQLPKQTKTVAVNPEVGRFVFLDAQTPEQVEVTYAYGFSHDIGGGSYDRSDSIAQVWSTDLTALDQESNSEDEPIQYFSPLYWEIEQARSGVANPLAEAVQTWNGTVQAWQGLHDLKCIPLARVPIPRTQAVQTQFSQQSRPRFRPGIVSGFNTIVTVGTPEFVVNPGLAVDALGRAIDFDQSVLIRLNELDPKLLGEPVIWVVVSYWSNSTAPNYQLNLIPHSQIEQYPENIYIRITGLSVDMQGNVQQQYEPQTFPFRTGIVEGFAIITPPETLEAIVTPGKAVDQLGRPILLDRTIPIDLRTYQNRTVTLAIAYSEESDWQIYVLLKEDLDRNPDNYPSGIYIRLAELFVPVVQFAEQPPTPSSLKLRPRFEAGIIQGLTVQAKPGSRMIIIKAGKAIDQNACQIEIEKDYPLGQLGAYRGQTVTLAITYRPEPFGLNWELKIIRAEEEANYPVDRYLRLAQLQISWTGKLTTSPIDLRRKFKPGIVRGLDVERRSFAKVKVNAGQAVDRLGQVICLEETCEVDLSKHPGRDLVIFISPEKRQGWKPLDVKTNDIGQSWKYIGVVPIEPETTKGKRNTNKMGVILIKDNHTYNGNLDVVIPSSEFLQTKLYIIAANGYRPHIQGNLSVQGIVPNYGQRSTLFEPGQLTIDGLLIEGKVTVEPGDLKHLEIAHCTLLPYPNWGLEVKAAQPLQPIVLPPVEDCSNQNEDDEEQESWGLIAIVMYTVTVLSQLIRLGFSPTLSPQNRLRVLVQFAQKEFETLWCALQEDLYQCQRHEEHESEVDCFCLDPAPGNPGQNRELSIALDYSICGLIRLPESVLKLSIQDSIIDRGIDSTENSQVGTAIAASGAMVTVHSSTILGTTKSRSIQASDSIFDQLVSAIDQQVGCLRFCYVPLGSRTPARYRCQPDLALQEIQTLPPAITTLAMTTIGDLRFLGTAGKGVFKLDQEEQVIWKQTNLKDYSISALISYIRNHDVLLAGTSTGKIFESRDNGENWSDTKIENNLEVTALAAYTPLFQDATLFAGTAGNGVFKFNSQTDEWELMGSDSLTQQNVTSLAIDTSGRIFVGTESGVFRWSKKSNRWRLIGLDDQRITALTIESDERIFAGTQDGQVFRSSNHGDRWTSVSKTLSSAPITSLVVQSVIGNATLDGLVLSGVSIHPLREGSAITIQGQTRVIQKVKFDPTDSEKAIEAIVDGEFCPELSGAVTFSTHFLFAGTSGSGIYRSINQGDVWNRITSTSHLADQNITALATVSYRAAILAGTAIGSVLSSDDRGNRWSPLNQGLNDVDQVLPLLTRIQPIFTSPHYEQPGYVQLSQTCAQELRRGAEDGSELGAFNALKQPQREDNLRALLKEYVRFGLKAELFYMT
jgi:photosystem II stability/assembly factor-like uncharacterized protein